MEQTQEPPITLHHQPEEEEHHETGASKMFRKVKTKAKKFKNSLTKHGQSHENDHDAIVEEDDEDDELEPEVIGAPVKSSVTGQPEYLNHHPRDANVPAPEEITPPGTKVFPVVSSDYTKPIEPVPSQDVSYRHEAPAHSVRDTSEKEERREEPIHHPLPELSDRGERREAHHEGLNTPVSLLSATEDVTGTFAPGGEDEYLGGQRKVNVETPKNLEDDLNVSGRGSEYRSDISDFQSKVTDPTKEGSGDLSTRSKESQEAVLGEDSPTRSAGESGSELSEEFPVRSNEFDQKTGSGINKSSPTRSHEFDMKIESAIDKNSPSRSHEFDLQTESKIDNTFPTAFGSESGAELGKEFPTERDEFDQKTESKRNEYSPTESGEGLGAPVDFPVRSHETDLKNESEIHKDSPVGFGGESGDVFPAKGSHGYREETENYFPARSDDVKVETEFGRDLPTETHDQFSPELSRHKEKDDFEETRDEKTQKINEFESGDGLGAPVGGNFPVRSHETDLKNVSEIYKDSPTRFGEESVEAFATKGSHGYGEETENYSPVKSNDVKVETELGRDVSSGTHEQFSPELSRPKERDDFEETRDETTQEIKPNTYTEQFTSAKNTVASKLGYSGETPKEDETKVADEKWTPVDEKNKETESTVTTKLPFSGGGSGVEETEHVEDKGVSAKLTPGEEDKALSEVFSDKLKIGGGEEEKKESEVKVEKIPTNDSENSETVAEEEKGGGGMVGMIKGWFGGGATEEVKPKSPHSVQEESSQSLGTTVGTKGLSDSGESELGETGGRGVVPVQRDI